MGDLYDFETGKKLDMPGRQESVPQPELESRYRRIRSYFSQLGLRAALAEGVQSSTLQTSAPLFAGSLEQRQELNTKLDNLVKEITGTHDG